MLPATRHKWTLLTLTPARQASPRFTYPAGMEGWVGDGLLVSRQSPIQVLTQERTTFNPLHRQRVKLTTRWSQVRHPLHHQDTSGFIWTTVICLMCESSTVCIVKLSLDVCICKYSSNDGWCIITPLYVYSWTLFTLLSFIMEMNSCVVGARTMGDFHVICKLATSVGQKCNVSI